MLNSISSPRRTLLKVLIGSFLTLSSTAAFAATPEQVIQKAAEVRQALRMSARQMNRRDLAVVDQQLNQILRLVNGGGGPGGPGDGNGGGGHYPPPPPPPIPQSQCKLLGRGNHGGYTYNFRLALNEQTMEASDNLDTILGRMEQYRRDRICGVVIADALTLAARGNYAGYTYNFRVMLRGEAIAASDNLETALAVITKLDTAGAGRVFAPNQTCQLLPRGNYGGYTYNYRVGVGAEVMIGTDSYPTATQVMQRLRSASICY